MLVAAGFFFSTTGALEQRAFGLAGPPTLVIPDARWILTLADGSPDTNLVQAYVEAMDNPAGAYRVFTTTRPTTTTLEITTLDPTSGFLAPLLIATRVSFSVRLIASPASGI